MAINTEVSLIERAKQIHVAVYVSTRDRAAGLPFIHLKSRGMLLQSFQTFTDAWNWMQPLRKVARHE